MKYSILLFMAFILSLTSTKGQITLAHSYTVGNYGYSATQGEIVNLSLSGKKIMVQSAVVNDSTSPAFGTDTITFYNMNYSFWKRVICPFRPGFSHIDLALYASETLFNTDALLEIAVLYVGNGNTGKYLIINETGVAIDSIMPATRGLKVYAVDTLGLGWQAIVYHMPFTPYTTTWSIYNLPGSLPCATCSGNIAGIAKVEKSNGIQTQPLPNPSSDQVKITFTLPQGSKNGNLVLYNTNGQKIKSFEVDNRYSFILLNNSDLASGVYYYNIEVDGIVSSTQKMVVIK